jgi:chromosome segregation ATPase
MHRVTNLDTRIIHEVKEIKDLEKDITTLKLELEDLNVEQKTFQHEITQKFDMLRTELKPHSHGARKIWPQRPRSN